MASPLGHLSGLTEDELRGHAAWLQALARRLVASEADADDLAQDAWLELARGSGPVGHLRALSARIVRRLAGHRRRGERARGEREARVARAEALPGPRELDEALETQRLLLEELAALDEIHRTTLMLRFHEGLGAAEIARRRGVPATTVRSQIQRALAELRARLDRRHGGERALWIALLVRKPERAALAGGALTGGVLVTGSGKALLVAGAAGLVFLVWRGTRRADPSAATVAEGSGAELLAEAPPERAAPPVLEGPADAARAPFRSGADGRVSAPVPDVPVLVLDVESGEPLPDFLLELQREGEEPEELTTDARGRALVSASWFAAPFVLAGPGDAEWDSHDPARRRELTAADRPLAGDTLVLRFAAGPTYTLLFDAPPPEGAALAASLSPGAGPTSDDPRNRASLHRDGARVWTRFAPSYHVRTPKGTEPWTITVLARDGLWRASGPVATLAGVQLEPVRLVAEACGVIDVRVESLGGPVEGECWVDLGQATAEPGKPWRYRRLYPLVPDGQSTVGGTPAAQGTGVRHVRFQHVAPGEYSVGASSRRHESAGRRIRVTAGATEELVLDLVPKPGMASLRVVFTSETGTLQLPILDVKAFEAGTNVWRSTRWLPESTWTRRVVVVEGVAGVDLELRLEGAESLSGLEWSPGITAVARPPGEFVFTCLDAGAAPARRTEVLVRDAAGAPLRAAGVATYFGAGATFLHETDESGRARLEPIQEGKPFGVLVVADGYRARFVRDHVLHADGEVLEVELEPGWGAWLDVVIQPSDSRAEARRAAGARVLVDGVEAGLLDERGQILLGGASAPRRIEIDLPGHRIAYGSIDPATGAPRAHSNGPLWVVLEPFPR